MFPSTSSVAELSWIDRIAFPAWVTGSDRRLLGLNDAAQALFQCSASDHLGHVCYEVFGGVTFDAKTGHRFCGPRCPVRESMKQFGHVRAAEVCVVLAPGTRTWVYLLPIPLQGDGETLLLHCALPADREHRIEAYLEHLAGRSPHLSWPAGRLGLSPREREVLELLAEDLTVAAIAERLSVSCTTVRNHIQHVLAKLGAHSIAQAVALLLLAPAGDQKSTSNPSRWVSPRASGSNR